MMIHESEPLWVERKIKHSKIFLEMIRHNTLADIWKDYLIVILTLLEIIVAFYANFQ